MPNKVVRIDVFISSPGDVAEERELVRRIIERLNRSVLRDQFFIVPMLYEEDVPPQVGQEAQLIVDRFMQVQRSQVMVCLFWSRMGTPFTITETGAQFDSGTLYEFIKGYEHFEQHGHPNILLYRRVPVSPHSEPEQRNKVDAFFNDFQGDNPRWKGLWKQYDDLREFEEKLRNDLERVIRGLHLDEAAQQWVAPPEFEEEPRRLDAAVPQMCVLGEPTEFRALICMPDSQGLAASLPAETMNEREIGQEDVRDGDLNIAFPKDPRSGKLRATHVTLEFDSVDFEFREAKHKVLLSPGRDSATVSVVATPLRKREKSLIVVRVKGQALDGGEYLCGSTSLSTTVSATPLQQIANSIWRLVKLDLGFRSQRSELRAETRDDPTTVQQSPVQIQEQEQLREPSAEPVKVPRFHVGGVVPPEYFVGRTEELQQAERFVCEHTGVCDGLLVTGERRSGKTSFAKTLLHRLMQRESNDVLGVYLNVGSWPRYDVHTFYEYSLLTLLGEVSRRVFGVSYNALVRDIQVAGPDDLTNDAAFLAMRRIFHGLQLQTGQGGESSHKPIDSNQFHDVANELVTIIRQRDWNSCVMFYDGVNLLPRDISLDMVLRHQSELSTSGLTSAFAVSPETTEADAQTPGVFRQIHLGPLRSDTEMRQLLAQYYFGGSETSAEVPASLEALGEIWRVSQGMPHPIQLIAARGFQNAHQLGDSELRIGHVKNSYEQLKREQPMLFHID